MKKDIHPPQVTDVGVAIVPETNAAGTQEWSVYLINMKEVGIEGVIVASRGYGQLDSQPRETSMLRKLIDEVPARSYRKVEPIMPELFALSNEYWLTFFESGKMYDRRFIFVPESIREANFTDIPLMDTRGVLIL